MKTNNPTITTDFFIYILAFGFFAIIKYSIFIGYKQDILEERLNFVTDQANLIKKANNKVQYMMVENSNYHRSYKNKMDEVTQDLELISRLSSMPQPVRTEIILGLYQKNSEEMPVKSKPYKFLADLVSPQYYDQLKNYSTNKLKKNRLDQPDIFSSGSTADFFTYPYRIYTSQKGTKFYDYLDYNPVYTVLTKMKFNGIQVENNNYHFNPKDVGKHLINVEIEEFSAMGDHKIHSFKKEIEVYP